MESDSDDDALAFDADVAVTPDVDCNTPLPETQRSESPLSQDLFAADSEKSEDEDSDPGDDIFDLQTQPACAFPIDNASEPLEPVGSTTVCTIRENNDSDSDATDCELEHGDDSTGIGSMDDTQILERSEERTPPAVRKSRPSLLLTKTYTPFQAADTSSEDVLADDTVDSNKLDVSTSDVPSETIRETPYVQRQLISQIGSTGGTDVPKKALVHESHSSQTIVDDSLDEESDVDLYGSPDVFKMPKKPLFSKGSSKLNEGGDKSINLQLSSINVASESFKPDENDVTSPDDIFKLETQACHGTFNRETDESPTDEIFEMATQPCYDGLVAEERDSSTGDIFGLETQPCFDDSPHQTESSDWNGMPENMDGKTEDNKISVNVSRSDSKDEVMTDQPIEKCKNPDTPDLPLQASSTAASLTSDSDDLKCVPESGEDKDSSTGDIFGLGTQTCFDDSPCQTESSDLNGMPENMDGKTEDNKVSVNVSRSDSKEEAVTDQPIEKCKNPDTPELPLQASSTAASLTNGVNHVCVSTSEVSEDEIRTTSGQTVMNNETVEEVTAAGQNDVTTSCMDIEEHTTATSSMDVSVIDNSTEKLSNQENECKLEPSIVECSDQKPGKSTDTHSSIPHQSPSHRTMVICLNDCTFDENTGNDARNVGSSKKQSAGNPRKKSARKGSAGEVASTTSLMKVDGENPLLLPDNIEIVKTGEINTQNASTPTMLLTSGEAVNGPSHKQSESENVSVKTKRKPSRNECQPTTPLSVGRRKRSVISKYASKVNDDSTNNTERIETLTKEIDVEDEVKSLKPVSKRTTNRTFSVQSYDQCAKSIDVLDAPTSGRRSNRKKQIPEVQNQTGKMRSKNSSTCISDSLNDAHSSDKVFGDTDCTAIENLSTANDSLLNSGKEKPNRRTRKVSTSTTKQSIVEEKHASNDCIPPADASVTRGKRKSKSVKGVEKNGNTGLAESDPNFDINSSASNPVQIGRTRRSKRRVLNNDSRLRCVDLEKDSPVNGSAELSSTNNSTPKNADSPQVKQKRATRQSKITAKSSNGVLRKKEVDGAYVDNSINSLNPDIGSTHQVQAVLTSGKVESDRLQSEVVDRELSGSKNRKRLTRTRKSYLNEITEPVLEPEGNISSMSEAESCNPAKKKRLVKSKLKGLENDVTSSVDETNAGTNEPAFVGQLESEVVVVDKELSSYKNGKGLTRTLKIVLELEGSTNPAKKKRLPKSILKSSKGPAVDNTNASTNESAVGDEIENRTQEAPVLRQRKRKGRRVSFSPQKSSNEISKTKAKKDRALLEDVENIPDTRRESRNLSTPAHIMFTGISDASRYKQMVVDLGAAIATDMKDCTHLVADEAKRTVKFMCAVTRGVCIVTTNWVVQSQKSGKLLDSEGYHLVDQKSEALYNYNLQETLHSARSSTSGLLSRWKIFVTKQTKPPPAEIREIVSCGGGKYCETVPKNATDDLVVISCDEDAPSYRRLIRSGYTVVSKEFLLTGILRHRLCPDEFKLQQYNIT